MSKFCYVFCVVTTRLLNETSHAFQHFCFHLPSTARLCDLHFCKTCAPQLGHTYVQSLAFALESGCSVLYPSPLSARPLSSIVCHGALQISLPFEVAMTLCAIQHFLGACSSAVLPTAPVPTHIRLRRAHSSMCSVSSGAATVSVNNILHVLCETHFPSQPRMGYEDCTTMVHIMLHMPRLLHSISLKCHSQEAALGVRVH